MENLFYPPHDEKRLFRNFWFGTISPNGWAVASSEVSVLFDRIMKSPEHLWDRPLWNDAVSCNFCADKAEYFLILRDLCIFWSENKIRSYSLSDDARLIQLVLILRETDRMVSRVSEQIEEWDRMVGYDEKLPDSGNYLSSQDKTSGRAKDNGPVLISQDLLRMKGSRSRLSQEIAGRSESLMPNCSVLVGPLVAARLLAAAGGLSRLSRMPGSAIQVLGAKNAFFSHRNSGSSSPKHGLIYEHKRVHAAPRKIRGRVSRTLAANLAVASRIDYYRGVIDPAFQERAESRIKQAGRKG